MNTLGLRAPIGLTVIGLLGLWSAADGKVVYVAKTGDNTNDGLSWAQPKLTVQAGLNAAVAGDEVWVAAGTYVEQITLTTGVALYGGFAGGEADHVQRDWKVNETILDGNAEDSVVTYAPQGNAPTRIDGFTIRNGKASYGGGGIVCLGSSLTIANNTITGNIAAGSYGEGGGILCSYASPTITNNTIAQNTAHYGAGISCFNRASPTISNNTIAGNTGSGSYSEGGGISCEVSFPTITHNMITNNQASRGGGVSFRNCSGPGTLVLSQNTIASNTVTRNDGQGGGVYCSYSSPMIANNTITGNTASDSYGKGGGIYCYYSNPTITCNMIVDNRLAKSSYSRGGGIYCESGFTTIINNVITGNSASMDATGRGGGIYCGRGSSAIINNTITGNRAPRGGGIHYDNETASIIANTIVAFNSSGIDQYSASAAPILRNDCVYGNTAYDVSGVGFVPGLDGNISVDPKLAGIAYGNLHIQPDSPCKDAGDDAQVQPGWTDVDGQARVQGSHADIRGRRIGRHDLAGGAVCHRAGEPRRRRCQRRAVLGYGQTDCSGRDRPGPRVGW